MDKKRIITTITLAFFLFGLPFGSFLYLRSGLDFYKEHKAKLVVKGDMPDFNGSTPKGEAISRDSLLGSVYVVSFFDINCTGICEKTKEQLLQVNAQFKNKEEILLLSFTTKPAEDNLLALTAYAQKNGINQNRWHLLNSEQHASVFAAMKNVEGFSIDPAQALMLVDVEGKIRGVYDALDKESFNNLVVHIPYITPPTPRKEYKYRPTKEL